MAGTCFLEDAARVGVGLLVADGDIGWWMAFFSMTFGGIVGDVGLYVIGRYATLFLFRRRWVDPARLTWMENYYKRNAVKAVMIARFIPGARTLSYVTAGAIRFPLPRFLLLLFLAAMVQSFIFIKVAGFIAEEMMPYLRDRRLQAAVFGTIVLALVLTHHLLTRRNKRKGIIPVIAGPEKKG